MFRRNPGLVSLFVLLLAASFPAASLAAAKPNVVLITLKSTRADRMGFLGSKAKLTPNLDAVAKESLIFERAYAQAPTTVASHATLFTGTYPQTHQIDEFGSPLVSSLPFAPDLLKAHGYTTAAFVGSVDLDPRNGLAPGFDRGFSAYDAGFHPPQLGVHPASVERHGTEVIARAAAWLARNPKEPFLLWVNLADPGAAGKASYNAAVRAADSAVGKLVAVLRARKLFDHALIVVAADHGESLGAHGEETYGVFLYDDTIHVPLLLKLPGNQHAGKRVTGRVSLVDVAPTILEVAGVPVPSQMQGRSLLRIASGVSAADQPSYARGDFASKAFGLSTVESWRAGKYLYIRAPKPELYDLSADPEAVHNLGPTSKATLETIAAQMEAFDRHFRSSGAETAQLSSSEMQKLASLGYVGLQKSGSANTAASGIDPKDKISEINRIMSAQKWLEKGNPSKAVATLQPAMSAASGMYLAQYVMGAALAEQQKYSQAAAYLHRAIELQPDAPWAHFEMGSALQHTGDYKTAVVHLEIAAERLPKCAEAHSRLAQAYEHLKRAEDARRERAEAAKLTGQR